MFTMFTSLVLHVVIFHLTRLKVKMRLKLMGMLNHFAGYSHLEKMKSRSDNVMKCQSDLSFKNHGCL